MRGGQKIAERCVCRCLLKIETLWGEISADATEGINGDLHRFTGKSRMRSFHAPEDINCQISPGNLELELRRDVKSANNLNKLTEKFGF